MIIYKYTHMDKQYNKGALLQIVTNDDETHEGCFYSQNENKTKITLFNVRNLSDENGVVKEGLSYYFSVNIRSIQCVGENALNANSHALKISHEEKKQIDGLITKYIFINQLDNTFFSAINDLKSYSYIAVGTESAEMGRKCKMTLLAVSTPDQIYIFDIQVMQHHAFNNGLTDLLESDSIKKIIHDCRKLSDCLFHKHAVKLYNVFDTQVGEAIVHKHRYGVLPKQVAGLQKCLSDFLGISANYIDEKKVDMVEWSKRPVLVTIKESIARNMLYMHKLSEVINDEIYSQFVHGTQCYVENLRKCDDYEAWYLGNQDKQLPKEFHKMVERY